MKDGTFGQLTAGSCSANIAFTSDPWKKSAFKDNIQDSLKELFRSSQVPMWNFYFSSKSCCQKRSQWVSGQAVSTPETGLSDKSNIVCMAGFWNVFIQNNKQQPFHLIIPESYSLFGVAALWTTIAVSRSAVTASCTTSIDPSHHCTDLSFFAGPPASVLSLWYSMAVGFIQSNQILHQTGPMLTTLLGIATEAAAALEPVPSMANFTLWSIPSITHSWTAGRVI